MTVGDIVGEPFEIHPDAVPKGGRRKRVQDPTLRNVREQIVLTGDVPSPANPPSGCRFHTRCFKAQEICSVQEPLLIMHPDGSSAHQSACHFAEAMQVV